MGKLDNKVAVISGGNSGIGLATAKLYREQGAKVIITASSSSSYDRAKQELGDQFDIVKTDVADLGELRALAGDVKKGYGGIDILFANAGIAHFSPLVEVSESFYDSHFNINVKGVLFLTQMFVPMMKKGGSVIFTTSGLNTKGMPGASVYSATKAAVRSLARSFSAEFAAEGIRFNALSPGPVDTPIHGKMGMNEQQMEEFAQQIATLTPIGRFGEADEIARAALFLASDDSSFLLGSELVADGGFSQL